MLSTDGHTCFSDWNTAEATLLGTPELLHITTPRISLAQSITGSMAGTSLNLQVGQPQSRLMASAWITWELVTLRPPNAGTKEANAGSKGSIGSEMADRWYEGAGRRRVVDLASYP